MFGAPGPGEVDPTPLVAVLVPILFGFMFADVGHGLVLSAASLLLWRRYPQTRFLLTCGLSAAGFGLLFGETFGLHSPAATVLPCPLDAPLHTILASIVFGALVLLLGLALSAIEAQFDQQAIEMGVLLVGHASIIIFEGLVVYVQTTRLILFEFFTRFLRAEGRLFRPLSLSTEAPD
jgi:vacuolar-type H+-ATPase subunit I/STV1